MYYALRSWAIALALCFSAGFLTAQYALPASELAGIPVQVLPVQDNSLLLTAELEARAPGRADRFAVPISTKIRPATHGAWSEDGTTSVWRMRISSPGAKTLNLGFSEYNLPRGSELFLVTEEEHLGPFTAADNDEHNQLWTPLVDGDELMIELRVPTASKKRVQLYLTFVNHDFIDARKAFSGACNLDVICSQADGWGIVDGYRDIIRSVAAYTIAGTDICTGFLVNNVNSDGKPLFMTANHCGVTAGRAPQLVAYWNFESPTCRQPNSPASGGNGGGRRNVFNSGATLLASYAPSDVTIIELDDPINPAANAFFAGWSAEAEVPTDTMIAIHHPGVDEKRISFSFQAPYRAAYFGAPDPDADHLEIPDWDIGTTEGGSSGSPVFDRFKRVRGQLHGGRAACGNDDFDSYGYFHTSWEGGGTPISRIRDYLDPCNTGTLTIDGFDSADLPTTLVAESNCGSGCTTLETRLPFVLGSGFPAGTTLSIEGTSPGISPTLSATTAAGGATVELVLPADATVPSGTYTVNIRAAGGTAADDITFTVDLSSAMAVAPVPVDPAEGAIDVLPTAGFSWNPAPLALGYDFELSTSSDFSTLLFSQSTTTETLVILNEPLAGNTVHYWRVRTVNQCGPGEWVVTSFTTADISCALFSGSDLPASITSSGTPQVRVELEVSNTFSVESFELNLDITHTFIGDLQARLRSPSGTEIQLFDAISDGSCGGENLSVVFTDDAMLTAEDFVQTCTGAAISTEGVFQPATSFSLFAGEPAQGTWVLIINDDANFDGGAVTKFDMQFCSDGAFQDFSVRSSVNALEVCQNETATVDLTLGADFSDNVSLLATADGQELDNYTFVYNPADQVMTVDFSAWSLLNPGDYTLTLTVINGDGTEQPVTLTLRVGAGVTESVLASPEDGIQVQQGEITFNWDAAGGATSYVLQYSLSEDFATIAFEQTTTATLLSLADLPTGDPIFWRVIARNDCGDAISEVRRFRIIPAGTHSFGEGRVLNVYPNPVKGLLTVETTGSWPAGLLATLFDATGRRLADYRMELSGRNQWDLGAIPAGVYYLRFASFGTERTERLVVLP